MSTNKTQFFFEKCAELTIRFRWLVLVLILGVTAFFFTQYPKLTFNGSFEIWYFDKDPTIERLNIFKEAFGNSNFVYIVADAEKIFESGTASDLKEMVKELESNVPYLKDITWIGDAENIVAEGDNVRILRLLDDIPHNQTILDQRAQLGIAEDEFEGRYISPDGKSAGILLEFELFPEATQAVSPAQEVTSAVFKVINSDRYKRLDIKTVGDPIFEVCYNEIAGKETPRVFMLCLAAQALMLLLFTRTPRGVLVPMFIVTLSFMWVLGAIALLGFELDLMIIGLPVILICIGIGDSVHAMSEFLLVNRSGVPRHQALVKAMGKVGLACLLTSITTAAGFAAFGSAPVKPFLRMGIYVPLGVMFAYLLTILLVPIFFSFGRKNYAPRRKSRFEPLIAALIDKLYDLLSTHPRKLLVLFAAIMGLSLVGTSRVEIESNTARYLSTSVPLRQHMDYIDGKMAGSSSLELVLDTGRPDGVKDPNFLRQMDEFERLMAQKPLVNKTISMVTILKKMRRAMHGGDAQYYSLPDSAGATAEYLALYEMAGGENLNKMLTLDYSKARLTLQTKVLSSKDTRYLVERAETEAARLFGSNVKVSPAGLMDMAKSLNDNMGSAQKSSIILAFTLIGLAMIIGLKSVRLGLISLLPNLLPVFTTLGLMGALGIDMDTILMTVCGMVIGVSIDDTTHMFVQYKAAYEERGNYKLALYDALHHVGRPVLFTTITLCLGFIVLTDSVLVGWVRIGLLAPFAFVWALLGDLLFSGPLLLLLKPFGKERVPD